MDEAFARRRLKDRIMFHSRGIVVKQREGGNPVTNIQAKYGGIGIVGRQYYIQYNDNDEAYVWLPPVAPDMLPVEQVVTTGFEGDDYIEVTAGLQAGDTIVLNIPQAEIGSIF